MELIRRSVSLFVTWALPVCLDTVCAVCEMWDGRTKLEDVDDFRVTVFVQLKTQQNSPVFVQLKTQKNSPVLVLLKTQKTFLRKLKNYHAYVPSSKPTLGNPRGSLLGTDYNGHTI